MAVLFDDASSEGYQYTSGTVPTTYPQTWSCWFNTDSLSLASQNILGAGSSTQGANNNEFAAMYVRGGNDALMAFHHQHEQTGGSASLLPEVTNTYSANTWQHGISKFDDNSGVEAYVLLNGDTANEASAGPNNSVGRWTNHDEIWVGRLFDGTPGAYVSGYVAEAAMWTADLSVDEMAALAAGFSPLLIRPQSLFFYAPYLNSSGDILNPGRSLTTAGTPVLSPSIHPPMIYPQAAQVTVPVAAAAGLSIPVAMHHYTKNLRAAS